MGASCVDKTSRVLRLPDAVRAKSQKTGRIMPKPSVDADPAKHVDWVVSPAGFEPTGYSHRRFSNVQIMLHFMVITAIQQCETFLG